MQTLPGIAGATGATGAGATRATGPPGSGLLQFTTFTGNHPGPTLASNGTYFVIAVVTISSGASSLVGACGVGGDNSTSTVFHSAFALQAGATGHFSISGMLTEFGAPETISVGCGDTGGNPISTGTVQWWFVKVS